MSGAVATGMVDRFPVCAAEDGLVQRAAPAGVAAVAEGDDVFEGIAAQGLGQPPVP